MKIRKAIINKRKKSLDIETVRGSFSLPFSRLDPAPTDKDPLVRVCVDPELENRCVTYKLQSGVESSVHLDAFLDYHQDPDHLLKLLLYKLTLISLDNVKRSGLGIREIARLMKTSPTQIYRLLDTAYYGKTVDQLLRLMAVIGHPFVLKDSKKQFSLSFS